jgi:hypothetical protein
MPLAFYIFFKMNIWEMEKIMTNLDNRLNQQKKQEASKKRPQNHYSFNAKSIQKKPVNPIPLYIMVKCNKCNKALGCWVDSSEEFLRFLKDKGWKRVDFTKSLVNENASSKDIHGVCCPGCQKDIEEWEKENHPKGVGKASDLYSRLASKDGIRAVDATSTATREPFHRKIVFGPPDLIDPTPSPDTIDSEHDMEKDTPN